MNECDKCGLEDPFCKCYEYDLEKRITFLEEELDKLTMIVLKISNHIDSQIEIEEEMKKFTQGFAYRKKDDHI